MTYSSKFAYILILFAVFLSTVGAFALPARPGITTYTQADGTEAQVLIAGDEHFHYMLSTEGTLVIEHEGNLYYARENANGEPVASAFRIGDRSAEAMKMLRAADTDEMLQTLRHTGNAPHRGPGLKYNATFPLTGDQRAIVILVEYQDVKFRTNNSLQYFSDMLNQPGFSDYGGTGSARDYYIDSSSGIFRPQFDVYGPVTLPHDMAWYGHNEGANDTDNCRMMVVHACQALDSEINFTQYDRDGDGTIDNVFLFYAGLGEASSGKADTVWPHSADVIGRYTFDGVTLQHYGCTNEWIDDGGGTGHPDGIGAFCHEFAHVLGLPDLYATTYPTPAPFTPGAWSLLDVGPYNNNGRTPPAMDLFSRYALGWASPEALPVNGNITLPAISECGNGYIIRTSDADEYFLIENRQKRGWDRFIPGHGMLVWHVHFTPMPWIFNTVNNDASHQYVDIIEADNILTEATRGGDAFPGTAAVTSIGATTTPALTTWCGETMTYLLSEIAEQPYGSVTFRTGLGATPPEAPVALDASDITPRGFTAHWLPVDGATEYRLRVFTTDADGHTTATNGYDNRIVGNTTEYTVTGLEPDTQYMYAVTATDEAGGTSAASNAITATTPTLTHEYVIPIAEISDITADGFMVNWDLVPGATDYAINITRRDIAGADTYAEGFDGKNPVWYSNSGYFYSAANYVGSSAPSLRLLPGEYVMSPIIDGPMRRLSFWHRGRGDNGSARILIATYANGCWTTLDSIPLTTTLGGAAITVDILPDDARAVRMLLSDASGAASVYTDDFALTCGGDATFTPIAEILAGNVTYSKISGLESGAEYLVTVTAVNSGARSLPSQVLYARTNDEAGITDTYVGDIGISISGRTVTIKADGRVEIFDIAGRPVAEGYASGSFSATLPHTGIYIVKHGAKTSKAIVK